MQMGHLQAMIDELSKRAVDSDLIALLATSQEGRHYNVVLARELRDVVEALKRELDRRQASGFSRTNDIRISVPDAAQDQ